MDRSIPLLLACCLLLAVPTVAADDNPLRDCEFPGDPEVVEEACKTYLCSPGLEALVSNAYGTLTACNPVPFPP